MTDIETKPQDQQDAMEMAISNVFNKNRVIEGDKIIDGPKKEKEKKEEPPLKLKEKKNIPEKEDSPDDDSEPPLKESEKAEIKSPGIDYKSEYEKLQKSSKDTQKAFHEERKKVVAYNKAVEKLKEQGALIEEEATLLLNHVHFEEVAPEEQSEYLKFHKVWSNEIQQIKKYAPNREDVDQHFNAFQHFVQTASADEIQEKFLELKEFEDDEVEFTRAMLDFGRQYNEDIFSDIADAGSIRKLKAKYSEKEQRLQKTIAKLEKVVLKYKEQYEDFDDKPANLNLPAGGSDSAHFDLSKIFNKTNRK